MNKEILRIKDGNVDLINSQGQKVKTYYRQGDAVRVGWYDEKGTIQVQLEDGDVLIINRGCKIVKRIK